MDPISTAEGNLVRALIYFQLKSSKAGQKHITFSPHSPFPLPNKYTAHQKSFGGGGGNESHPVWIQIAESDNKLVIPVKEWQTLPEQERGTTPSSKHTPPNHLSN